MKNARLSAIFLIWGIVMPSVFAMGSKGHHGTMNQAFTMLQTGDERDRWIFGFYDYHSKRAGGSAQSVIGTQSSEPDNFLDTVIGGWWFGYHYFIRADFPFFSAGSNYSSFWHFTSCFSAPKNGDKCTGYGYRISPDDGFFGLNGLMKSLLYNQEVKSGDFNSANGTVISLKDTFQLLTKDWLGFLSDFYNGEPDSGWGIPGASDPIHQYQTLTSSTDPTKNGQFKFGTNNWRVPSANWKDIQDVYFNPMANQMQYWYNLFSHNSAFDDIQPEGLRLLGYVHHGPGDVCTPQHAWSTLSHYHQEFESFIDEFITKGFKADKSEVIALIEAFEKSERMTYAQQFTTANDLDNGAAPIAPLGDIVEEGLAIKDLKVNGKIDYTLLSVGDIMRWLAEQGTGNADVLADDSETTFTNGAKKAITCAVAGEILILRKAAADLYKKKQYEKILAGAGAQAEIFGNGIFSVGGNNYNQIR